MLAEQRHQYILAQVTKNGALSVAELVRELNVSRETIRRDLNTLAARGLVVTTHGGARPIWCRTVHRSSSIRAVPPRPSRGR
jgi:DeoR/GlpR family transcriptional regulator of sugar metabolism